MNFTDCAAKDQKKHYEILSKREPKRRLRSPTDAVCDDILERALVALVPSEGFGIDGYVRLSYATSMENIKEGLDRIEKYVHHEY